jgi:hypothetical protein
MMATNVSHRETHRGVDLAPQQAGFLFNAPLLMTPFPLSVRSRFAPHASYDRSARFVAANGDGYRVIGYRVIGVSVIVPVGREHRPYAAVVRQGSFSIAFRAMAFSAS